MAIECEVPAQEEAKHLRGGSPPPFRILVEAKSIERKEQRCLYEDAGCELDYVFTSYTIKRVDLCCPAHNGNKDETSMSQRPRWRRRAKTFGPRAATMKSKSFEWIFPLFFRIPNDFTPPDLLNSIPSFQWGRR